MRLDQLKVWREQVGRVLLAVDFRPLSDTPIQMSLAPILNDNGVRIARWRHSPGLTFRDEELVRDGEASFSLIIPYRDGVRFEHRGRAVTLKAGEATLLRNCEPGMLGSARENSYLAIVLPCSPQIEACGAQDLIGERWPKRLESLRLLRTYVEAYDRLVQRSSAGVDRAVSEHVVQLASLAISEALGAAPGAALSVDDEPRTAIALDFIARNYFKPGLCVHDVARHQGISVRYLQLLCERRGVRLNAHINAVRLEAVRSMLAEPRMHDRQVSDIALSCGFSDVSHFNRLFRRTFGTSPTAFRHKFNAR
ncbi:MAG: AraC family transcriptional regulator [Hyphomicrobiaceae bacterium]|nr:AraC family transcriptional regulator [Hyphomicrobiaceae bacterium]